MRTQLLCLAVIGAGAALLLAGGQSASADIAGSDHDFSTKSWNSGGEICEPCHTPHGASTTVTDAPLWNHVVTGSTFTLYSSTTLDATVDQPSGVSKLCLSCHDGSVGLDAFGGTTSSTNYITGNANLGTDLSQHHPVGFTYNTSLATTDGSLFDPSTKVTSLSGTIDNDLLVGSKLECSSCHDVHNGAGNSNLLVIANSGSALCLTCHDK